MRKIAVLIAVLGTSLLPVLSTVPAHAQATRTWVSGVGDDANPCSRTAPCLTFAGAISKTAAGGEIDALDPGGFGMLTITKSITIDGGGGQVASMLPSPSPERVDAGNVCLWRSDRHRDDSQRAVCKAFLATAPAPPAAIEFLFRGDAFHRQLQDWLIQRVRHLCNDVGQRDTERHQHRHNKRANRHRLAVVRRHLDRLDRSYDDPKDVD